ncbi:DUF5047 domain-containing protein [Streptomyces sp. NPDC029080]|uniref:DUF5047 domain-containing protein n=1 Tax=Streptomyces sp. NPDC029080 TaxID=3155017 RepID=UPI0033C709F0
MQLLRADGVVIDLPHTEGSVTVDRGNAVRRTCSVSVPDVTLLPMTPTDQLAIYGARLRIRRGVIYGDGSIEAVPLGLFRIDSISGDPAFGPVTISGSGLEAVIADDKFTAPYSTRGATNAITAITNLIQSSMPGAAVANGGASDAAIGTMTWDAQGDRWAAVQECATAIGAEVYADADGQFIIAELPDLLTAPVAWDIDAGTTGVLISADRAFSRDGMYNMVVASGENAEDGAAPVTATASDTDPTSPTYVSGPFGRVPLFYASATLTTTALALNAAQKLLRDSVKPNATVSLTSLPNPCLEPGDVLRVTYEDGRRELQQVQSFTISLGLDSISIETIGGKQDT